MTCGALRLAREGSVARLWELSFGIYLIVKGFRPSPILAEVDSGPVARSAGAESVV